MNVSVIRDACLEERAILELIREYFEQGGHAECLVTLENYFATSTRSSSSGKQSQAATPPLQPAPSSSQRLNSLPLELAALRELTLEGKWDQVFKYLDAFNEVSEADKEGLTRCRYAAHKQKFLEILHHIQSDIRSRLRLGFGHYENEEILSPHETEKLHKFMEAQLAAIKPLCPTSDHFQSLQRLFSYPSFASSKEFSKWQLHSGRLETFYEIGAWISKVLYLNVKFPKVEATGQLEQSCTLLKLLAKGLLYEQCERICRTRCGEASMEQVSGMLDLGAWIQQQPDSSFQLQPSELSLVVTPWTKPPPPELQMASIDMGVANRTDFPFNLKHPTSRSASVPSNQSSRDAGKLLSGEGDIPTAKVNRKGLLETASNVTNIPESPLVQAKVEATEFVIPTTPPFQSPKNDRSDFSMKDKPGFFPSTTPLPKTGRDSSTPKNVKSSRASLNTSPPSSPINSALPSKEVEPLTNSALPLQTHNGARNHIRFSSEEESQRFPTVSLISTLSDPQVVRSVAFSGSGKFVAVGTNSRMLRVCYTTSLLQEHPREELDMQPFPHYHKSSIYCLAWLNDSVLASGSNDHCVRLLTCVPESSSGYKFRTHKPIPLRCGTIRDVMFTQEGLLASGGGGSMEVKLIDIQTRQCVMSLAGHTDQVLALGNLPGGLIASGGQDKNVFLWDIRMQQPVNILKLDSGVASLACWHEMMVTAHLDGKCTVQDMNMFKCVSTFAPHTDECRSVRFYPHAHHTTSRTGSWILSGSYDGTICLTDTKQYRWTELCQHSDKVIQCRWHPEGKLFASTGADRKACFWTIDW